MTAIDLGSTGLRATKSDGVLRVVLDRPERKNACTVEMYHGIKKAAETVLGKVKDKVLGKVKDAVLGKLKSIF